MKIFLGILIFFLAFGWLALLFSTFGLLCTGSLFLSILPLSIVAVLLILPKISQNIDLKTGKIFFLVMFISLLASLATCYFATPTVFGGRDQGSIGTAAIFLAQNRSLETQNPIAQDLVKKYGAGKALNFPGFDYTKNGDLISRFPLGYTAYLASAYTLAGLKGIQYANFIPLFFFLVIFWLILKEFFNNKISFLGFLLAATFFPFLWFAKYALTETYMLFLVSTGIYFLIACRRRTSTNLDVRRLQIALAAFALSALVRIEGIVFFFLAAIYILLLHRKKLIDLPKNFKKYLLISTLVLLGLYIYLNFPDLIDSSKNLVKAFLPNSTKESAPSANLYSYLARIFFNYNIIAYLVLGLAGIVWSILSSRALRLRSGQAPSRDLQERSDKSATKISRLAEFIQPWDGLARNDSLIMIFITFPTFIYLLSPMITLDEPWFLRRFVFAVFPALIFYSIYTLHKFFYHKKFLYFALVVLIAANSIVSWRFFTASENKELLPQIEKLSQKFSADDLILVDRMATGSGFSLASEPLRTIYGKNAVYFFNADDLKFINQDRYKNIYLLAPLMSEEQNPWYADLVKDKSMIDAQIITNNFLQPSDKKYSLAQNVTSEDLVGIWKIK